MSSFRTHRFQASLNIVLVIVVLVQAWMLYGRNSGDDIDRDARAATDSAAAIADRARKDDPPAGQQPDPLAIAVMDRLQRIDARLAALEAGTRPQVASPVAAPLQGPIEPRVAAEADRRLAALLPDRDIDHQDWVRWQTALAALPAEEQFALSAALSRGLNENRLRLRF